MTISPAENVILDGSLLSKLRAEIKDIFNVISLETPRQAPQGTILFLGDLLIQDSEVAYDLIAERWRPYDYTPILRQQQQGQIALIAQPGVINPKPSNPWINLGLLIVTLISVLLTGAMSSCQSCPQTFGQLLIECFPRTLADWARGFPMMLAMMAILLSHEFGHYFAARYHRVAVTLPYFIPLPIISPVGTLGAFIQLRSPFKTKKQLFDIGIAGPLGGLIFAIPLIFWGVSNSLISEISRGGPCPGALEGNSIFYLGVKYIVHGQLLPSFDAYAQLPFLQEFLLLLAGIIPPTGGGTDIFISPLASAAWFGLFVTAMNLLPVGQLDGAMLFIVCWEKRHVGWGWL